MQSGIFAVVTIGSYRLYIGEVHHLEQRWKPVLAQLNQGNYPDIQLQQTWNRVGGKRRFTFHTSKDLIEDLELLERAQFLADVESQRTAVPKSSRG
ncbi:hypothetical protein [Leptolyngbya sp. PL-A3]|uniref:hypothetical protein n=1 Tax=Leptolyngbya sp. PL-A3 TaxID=2933911 RepID=UPI003296DD40